MSFLQNSPAPLLENQVAPLIRSADRTIALPVAQGEILVLITCAQPTLVLGAFHIDAIQHAPDLVWSLRDLEGRLFESREAPIRCHHRLALQIPVPITIIRTARGYKTMMNAVLPADCRLHHLDYLRRRLPEVYQRIQF